MSILPFYLEFRDNAGKLNSAWKQAVAGFQGPLADKKIFLVDSDYGSYLFFQ
jgi:hypothetical protein